MGAARHPDGTRRACRRIAEATEGVVQGLEAALRRAEAGAGFTAAAGHGSDELRRVAQRMLIASDTNLWAGDYVEQLLHASGPRAFLAVQAAYLQDQSPRSAQQMINLHRATTEMVLGSAAFGSADAPQSDSAAHGRAGSGDGSASRADAPRTDLPFQRGRTRGLAQGHIPLSVIPAAVAGLPALVLHGSNDRLVDATTATCTAL